MHSILVLGGYGFFGARIARALCGHAGIRLIIAGRDALQAQAAAQALGGNVQGIGLDAGAPDLAAQLAGLGIDTLIHTAGPFQGQDYHVARAAIAAGAHYIDLADGRDFVCGIGALDAAARERGVLVTSGASSLPALSAAVVDHYAPRFAQLETIRIGIASGARSPGLATVRGVFGYCGKPLRQLEAGQWRITHGWLDLHARAFPAPVGRRLLGSCDVPDLTLFPQRYPGVQTVSFHAGFASVPGHLAVWAGAWLVRLGLLRSLAPLAGLLHALSRPLEMLASDKGGMFVQLEGRGADGAPLHLVCHLVAAQHHGPHIPCGAAIALARQLAGGRRFEPGARPCMGLLRVADYLAALEGLDIREIPA